MCCAIRSPKPNHSSSSRASSRPPSEVTREPWNSMRSLGLKESCKGWFCASPIGCGPPLRRHRAQTRPVQDVRRISAVSTSSSKRKSRFHQIREIYSYREQGCPFCDMKGERVISENSLAYAVRDLFPATPLHSLIIPKRHVADFFALTGAEDNAVMALLRQTKSDIVSRDKNVEGFNMGINNGPVAGQTVFHVHLHLIPRRKGDVEDPRGGLRGIIPGKAAY